VGVIYLTAVLPIFLLCGCLFDQNELKNIEKKIDLFKQEFFKTTNVIFHSREIRKCEGAF